MIALLMKKLLLLLPLLALTGCALFKAVAPGSDPLVVRCEQSEAIAAATLDTFEKLDNANRDFWRTNVPALHQYAEFLRAPVLVNGTNALPRGLGYILALETVKQQYKAAKASSNSVVIAISVLESALWQAQSFLSQQQQINKTNVSLTPVIP